MFPTSEFTKMQDNRRLRFLKQLSATLGKQLRVAVMGPKGVGKTSIFNSIYSCLQGNKMAGYHGNKKEWIANQTRKTRRMQKGSFSIEVMDSSNSMPPNFRKLYIRNANVFVLVYDVTNMASFDEISRMRCEIAELKGDENIPMIVLGNKLDTGVRRVDPILADCVVSMDWEAIHFEVSANDCRRMGEIVEKLLVHPSLRAIQEQFEMYVNTVSQVTGGDAMTSRCHYKWRNAPPRFLTWLRAIMYPV